VADHHEGERHAVRAGDEHASGERLLEGGSGAVDVEVGDRRDQLDVDLAAEHRGGRQRAGDLGAEQRPVIADGGADTAGGARLLPGSPSVFPRSPLRTSSSPPAWSTPAASRASTAAIAGSARRLAASRRSCRHGQYAGAPPPSHAAPATTSIPSASARSRAA